MGKTQNPFLTIQINCNPMVKMFLENNFGNPAKFESKHILNKLTTNLLCRNNTRFNNVKSYPETCELQIIPSVFIRDGYFISDAGVRDFNMGVENFIKQSLRNHVDTLLISKLENQNWKKKYIELVDYLQKEDVARPDDIKKQIKELRANLEQHEIDIKEALIFTTTTFLKLDLNVLPYETSKKDYYRYRINK